MKTAVVILNWNTRDYLSRFLPGVLEFSPGAGVVVADSGSTDGSLQLLRSDFPQVKVIPLGANYGFTGGYDRALKGLEADYYLLLNSDVEVCKGWLEPLESWMDAHPECAVCGPKLLKYDRRDEFEYAGAAGGWVDRYGFPFCRGRVLSRTETDRGQYDAPADVLWVSGAAMMIRRSVWDELGGLDDRFFAHMEEIDFCWRAFRRGYSVSVVPASRVYHLGGGTLPRQSAFKLELNYRNNLLLLHANLPLRGIIAARYLLDIAAAVVYFITLRPALAAAVFRAHRQYRRMKGEAAPKDAPVPSGYRRGIMIVPLALLKGRKVFEYLKRYEDSHRRSR